MRRLHFVLVLAPALCPLAACGGDDARDLGPPPGPGHQQIVRERMDRVLGDEYELAEASSYRFAEPAHARVPRWHFEPGDRRHDLASGESIYVHGWGVEFRVRPKYAGYPEQPMKHGLALFADGELRGLFTQGSGNAPLELDKWHESWVDRAWYVGRFDAAAAGAGAHAPPKPAGR